MTVEASASHRMMKEADGAQGSGIPAIPLETAAPAHPDITETRRTVRSHRRTDDPPKRQSVRFRLRRLTADSLIDERGS